MARIPGLPDLASFIASTFDVYPGNIGGPPPTNPMRTSGISCLIAGSYDQGTMNRGSLGLVYTHVLICDPSIQIQDGYAGRGVNTLQNNDILAIPAGQTNNYWLAVFSFVAVLPELGKRRVILADRYGTVGDWAGAI